MRSLFNFSSRDIAIDLGTANTVVYVRGAGIITSEPSVVAMEVENGVRKVRAIGDDAIVGVPTNEIATRPAVPAVTVTYDVSATPGGATIIGVDQVRPWSRDTDM